MARRPRREQLRHRIPGWKYNFPRYFTTLIQPPDWSYERDRDTYVYTFQPPRLQRDAVLRLINKTIRDLMHGFEHGIAMCNTNFRVVQSTTAPPIWPPRGSHETKLYTFMQDDEEFPITVPVSIIPPEGALEASKIHVRVSCKWVPIQTWLIELAEESCAMRARSPESIQYFWNNRNGRTFNFANLPADIRYVVLEHAMAPQGEIYPVSEHHCNPVRGWESPVTVPPSASENTRIFMGFGYTGGRSGHKSKVARPPYEIAPEVHPRIQAPCTALLLVSKWLSHEALKVGWNTPVKCFVDADNFLHTLTSKCAPVQQHNVLGRIELSFTTGGWLRFFGIEISPGDGLAHINPTARHLARLVDTTRLTLRFRDPDDGWLDHPWGIETNTTACQTAMIDWIMTLAFPCTRHIATIQLTGCIRAPQKQRWEALLQQDRAGVPHGFDHVAAADAIRETDATQLPPRCVCPKSCLRRQETRFCGKEIVKRYGSIYTWCYFDETSTFDYDDGRDDEEDSTHENKILCWEPW